MTGQPIRGPILRLYQRSDVPSNSGQLDSDEVYTAKAGSDPAKARQELLVKELYQEVHYLQRVLNRVPDVFGRQPSRANEIYDPDQTVIQLRSAGPALSPIELAQSMASNIAEIKGIMAAQNRTPMHNLAEEQEEIYARLGREKLTERLSFFSTWLAAQAATLFGVLIAWLAMGITGGGMQALAAIDLVLVGPAQAALTPMIGSEAAVPVEDLIKASILVGIALLCLFAYALSIYTMFISRRPTKSQVDLAKFYSGFCTGLMTNLLSVL